MGKIRKTFKILTEKDDKKRYKKIKSLKESDLQVLVFARTWGFKSPHPHQELC